MEFASIVFSQHAFVRMFERGISPELVERAARDGRQIASYPEDQPYPSSLLLFWIKNKPVHIVIAIDELTETCHVITAYWPESRLWSDNFETRRNK